MAIKNSPILKRVFELAEQGADKTALVCGEEAVSYALLKVRILSAAAFLQEHGVNPGDCVALSAIKGLDFVYAYFGVHLIGGTVVVVDPESNLKKMAYILELTKPRFAVGFQREGIAAFGYEVIPFDGGAQPVIPDGLNENDVADIVFTTGTTGNPKGVLLSHFNIFSSADNINGFIGNTADDIEVLGLPLCHSFGLGRLRCNLIKGATLVVLPSFANIKQMFAAIEKYHVTGFGVVPAIWAYIRKFSGTRISKYAPQIKYIEIGSAAMPLESKKELCELFPTTRICHHYGLTEASRNAFMEYHEALANDDLATIGREVCDRVKIKVFDEVGNEVSDGTSGEICVKGNMVMKGYFKAEETAAAYFGEYFRTGDIGYRGKTGNLYLVSRKKEMINVGGKKVSPVEIEEAVLAMGGIEDCGCIGVPDPEGILGEVPKLFVQRSGCTRIFEEIAEYLKTALESYKQPCAYAWIDAIPKTASGKKQRLQLKNEQANS